MYITVEYIKNEISLYYPIDNRSGNKKVSLIRAYFVYSFCNVENDKKIHLKNDKTLKVKMGCYTMKDIAKNPVTKLNNRSNNGNCDPAKSRNCNETEEPLGIEQGKRLVEYNRRKKEELKHLNEQITEQDSIEHKPKSEYE